ncbi:MAG TPA: TIM barrel protein [Pirellulales bacterium]|nr:TIM barrel protein [Pirellulales bacterium]
MFRNLSPAALCITGRQSEIIELSLSYGFKGIDLDLTEFQQSVKTYGLPHARRLIDSARLKLGTFRLPLVWDEDDEAYQSSRAAAEELLSLAAELGLSRAITTVAPANDLRPYHENFEFHRRRLAEIGELLAPRHMKLGLEFYSDPDLRKDRAFQFIHSFDALVTLVGMIRAGNVGIVADLFELHVAGGSFSDIHKLGADKIINVIVSDAPADKPAPDCDKNDRLMVAETGAIELPPVLVQLAELGYDGPITPAVASQHVKGMKREQIVRTAGERLTQAWTAAGLNAAGKLAPAVKQ